MTLDDTETVSVYPRDANETRRRAAQKAGRETYGQDVIEMWPACVTCDRPIRRNVEVPGKIGLHRACDCPGVLWRLPLTGGSWERVTVSES